ARLATEGRSLTLPFQADHLAVLDIGRQLDRDLAAAGEHRRHLRRGGCFLDGDVQRHVEVGAARCCLLPPSACAGMLLLEGVSENLAEDVVARITAEGIAATRAAAAEFEMGAARSVAGTAETGERIAAAAGRAFETVEARLAVGIDLAAV